MPCKLMFTVVLFCCGSSHCIAQDNWPQFRGTNADGNAVDHDLLPTTWSKTENVKWTADIPGWGWSCPVVWGDRVFLTTVIADEENTTPKKGLYLGQGVREPSKGIHHWMVYCFNLHSGKEIWKHEAHSGSPAIPRHPKSTYATETPITDGTRVYVLFGDVGLYCYDMEGEPVWKREIEPHKTFFDYGAAASPVLHGDQLIIVYDNQEDSYIASYETASGEERWKTARDEKSTWATPFVWQNYLRTEIVVCGKSKNRSYSLEGDVLWEFDGRMSNLVIPSPFAAHGLLYITSGYVGDDHRPVYAVRPGAAGDISLDKKSESNEFISWYLPKGGPYNPTPIVYGDNYYTLFDRGFMTAHNARNGKEVYGKTGFGRGSTFTASPWAYDEKLFFLSEDGDTYVVKAGDEFELLTTNSLGELCLSTPAISQGNLLIRTASKLYCISKSSPE